MERLAAKYRERIEAQKVAIQVEAQRRSAREEEARDRGMTRRRSEIDILERTEVARIEAVRSGGGGGGEDGSREAGRRGGRTRYHGETGRR